MDLPKILFCFVISMQCAERKGHHHYQKYRKVTSLKLLNFYFHAASITFIVNMKETRTFSVCVINVSLPKTYIRLLVILLILQLTPVRREQYLLQPVSILDVGELNYTCCHKRFLMMTLGKIQFHFSAETTD